MPRLPVDFTLGAYRGAFYNQGGGARSAINLFPETVPGGSDKPILKAPSGFSLSGAEFGSGAFKGGIKVGKYYYCVVGTDFYEVEPFVSYTVKGVVASAGRYIFANNGEYIVLIDPTSTDDYAYDLNTGTLTTIVSLDGDYAGFGATLDVVYKDDYFVFCTESTVFHGDTTYDAGKGLAFDPTSFDNIPTEAGTVSGLAVANSQLYVMGYYKTMTYQNVGTIPFAFQRNVNLDIEVGLMYSTAKLVVGEIIYFYGSSGNRNAGIYRISGSQFDTISTGQEEITAFGNAANGNNALFATYGDRRHQFLILTGSESTFTRATLVYDITESTLKGFPVWHTRGYVSSTDLSDTTDYYPVKYASIDTAESSGSDIDVQFILQKYTSTGAINGCQIGTLNENRTFDMSQEIDGSTAGFTYSFPFIRDGADPVRVKSVRMRFNENVNKVELLSSETGRTNDLLSHGEIDMSSQGNVRTCQWRRINRFSSQVMFTLRITEIESYNRQTSVFDGNVEI